MCFNINFFLLTLAFCIINITSVQSQKCNDFLLFDGSENVISFDIDTTGNWWILTQPYSDEYRLILPNRRTSTYKEIKDMTFSPDGNRWAFFGRENTGWNLVTSDTIIPLFCEEVIQIGFSKNSEGLFFACRNGLQTSVFYNNKQAYIINFNGKIFSNFNGNLIAFVLTKGNTKTLIIPGRFKSENFDEIHPVGFWYDDDFIYAGKHGNFWQIFKNQTPLTEEFLEILDMEINWNGTVAAFVVSRNLSEKAVVIISETYYEPYYSRSYDNIYNLEIHPTEPITVFIAKKGDNSFVVYGNVEYSLGSSESFLKFSYDGSEIYYCYCNIECYLYVDGNRHSLSSGISCQKDLARKPQTSTIAYTNNSTLVLLDYFTNILYSGMMVNKTTKPIYNWKTQRYEALGEINNKIYLLTCKP